MANYIILRSAWPHIRNLLLLAFVLAGCQASLAPSYDPALIAGVNAANQEALVLFSEVSTGAPTARYATLAPKYDALIGKFDALRLQAEARDVPPLGRRIAKALTAKNEQLAEICGEDAINCVNASPRSLEAIVNNFARMKTSTRTKDLTAETVTLHKNAYEISIQQVLVVETALGG